MGRREACEGIGAPAVDPYWETVICPTCHGIAPDEDGRVGHHTVLVIDCGGDDE